MSDIEILIVDDSAAFRKLIRDQLSTIPGARVVGSAANGLQALEKAEALRPDLITLDLEMPVMDGMTCLARLMERGDPPLVSVISAHSQTQNTLEALAKGALDFIVKSESAEPEAAKQHLHLQLTKLVRTVRTKQARRTAVAFSAVRRTGARKTPRAVVIGISTGGPMALHRLLPSLTACIPVPILIVQHMPAGFTEILAARLDKASALRVVEAVDGPVRSGTVYLAPGGRHMRVETDSSGEIRVRSSDDPPEHNCRPSVDYLFRSAAKAYDGALLAVVMTGMGADGTQGAQLIRRRGGTVLAQDEASSVVFGMPREAITAGAVDRVVPLDELAAEITREVYTR